MVASHFLHAFIVVQPIDACTPNVRYRITVTARDGVNFFGPTLPDPSTPMRKGPELREFLLTKLLNAEHACYKAQKFARLELRTRTALLSNLVEDLHKKTCEFLRLSVNPLLCGSSQVEILHSFLIFLFVLLHCFPFQQVEINTKTEGGPQSHQSSSSGSSGGGARFIDTVRKALSSARKSQQEQAAQATGSNKKSTGSSVDSTPAGTLLRQNNNNTSSSKNSSFKDRSSAPPVSQLVVQQTHQTSSTTPTTSPSLDTPPSRIAAVSSRMVGQQQPDSDDSSLNSVELDSLQHHQSGRTLTGRPGMITVGGGGGTGTMNSTGSGSSAAGQPPRPPTEDSDTGMESLSSAETPATAKRLIIGVGGGSNKSCNCYGSGVMESGMNQLDEEEQQAEQQSIRRHNEVLMQEVDKLKCDKLELLRQNVVSISFFFYYVSKSFYFILKFQSCQRDIKRLKEREFQLHSDLINAGQELQRLRLLLRDHQVGNPSSLPVMSAAYEGSPV